MVQNTKLPKVIILATNSIEGGAAIHIETLVSRLKDRVEFVIIFGSSGSVLSRLIAKGFNCIVLKELNNSSNLYHDSIALYKLCRIIGIIRPDILHLHTSKAGFIGRIAGFITNTNTVFTVHGWGWRGMSRFKGLLILLIERLLGKLPNTSYIYVSNSVQREATNLVLINKNKGKTILNGTDDFGLCDFQKFDKFTLIMPARVSNAKDHKTLVMAFEKLDFESSLILCGEGTDNPEFIDYIEKFAPNRIKDITFMGSVSNMNELLSKSHVFTLISNFEALPLSIIEAMSASLPVIASKVGGVSELIIENYNGFLVPAGDSDFIVQKINELLIDENRIKMGVRGRETYLNKFSSDQMAKEVYIQYLHFCKS